MGTRFGMLLALNLGLLTLLAPAPTRADSPPVNGHVFVIHSYHAGLSWTDSIMDGIHDTFSRSGDDLQLSAEFLDSRRYVDPERTRQIRDLLLAKLQGTAPALVMVSDNAALNFMLSERDRLFPDTPMVFCGINDFTPAMLPGKRGITGVAEDVSIVETVAMALRLHPGTEEIIVIGRTTVAADKYNRDSFVAALPGLPPQMKVTFWDDLPVSELQTRLEKVGPHSVLFLNGLITDETGRQLMYGETTKWVSRHSAAPVYSFWDVYLGYGIVGGKLVSGYRQGQMAAELALRILKGEKAEDLPVVKGVDANQNMFDYQQVVRFRIPLAELPQDALLVNRPDSFYQKYRTLVWGTAAVLLGLSGFVILLMLDTLHRRTAAAALRRSEEKYRELVENANSIILRVDAAGRVTFFNEFAQKFFGYAEEEILGRSLIGTIMPETESSGRDLRALLDDLVTNTERYAENENENMRRNGERVWVAWSNKPVRDASGKLVEILCVGNDTTERKRAEEALQRAHDSLEAKVQERTAELAVAKERAEAASKAKSVFLANMSHELRTPLNAILGYSQLLQRSPALPPQQREYLKTINRSGEHLVALINDVLEISRIEARRITLEPQNCDLHLLLHDLELMFRVRTDAKGLQFELTGIDNIPRYIVVDDRRLRQILVNLLGNAVKYTLAGRILVHLAVKNGSADGMRLVAEVKDSGIGIAEGELDRVFQYFEQAASGRQSKSGTGLGLAISREFARMMGGDITVTSQVGEGSTFRLEIGIQEGNAPDLAEKRGKGMVVGLEPGQFTPRILVAEDQAESRRLMVNLLEDVGFEVREAAEGREAVRVFEEFRPHFVWMDMRMPVMNGLEATRRIKATNAGKSTVVIALTAQALEEEREPILAAGCDDLVRKPFREEEIFELMAKHLGLRYRYERDQMQERHSRPETTVTAAQLAALPAGLRGELQEAVLRLDPTQTLEVIEKIAGRDAALGAALRTVAENLDYPRLLQLLEQEAAKLDDNLSEDL